MISIAIESHKHIINYRLFTIFHSVSPAIELTYRLDGKSYGENSLVDISNGSGGVKKITYIDDYIEYTKQMKEAWKVANKIVKHHKNSKEIYKSNQQIKVLK